MAVVQEFKIKLRILIVKTSLLLAVLVGTSAIAALDKWRGGDQKGELENRRMLK